MAEPGVSSESIPMIIASFVFVFGSPFREKENPLTSGYDAKGKLCPANSFFYSYQVQS